MINNFHWFYWQFQLITMSHMMDSFEWWLFHCLLFFTVMLVVFIFYVIVPLQIHLVLETVCHLFGLQCKSNRSAIMWIFYISQGLCDCVDSFLLAYIVEFSKQLLETFWDIQIIIFWSMKEVLKKNHNNCIQQVPKHCLSVCVSYLISGMSYTNLNFSKEAYLLYF